MNKEIQASDLPVNTFFQKGAIFIEPSEKSGMLLSSKFKASLGWSASAVLDKLMHCFTKTGKQRQKLTHSQIVNMIGKETCSERTITRVLTKLHNLGLIIRETITKRGKTGQLKSENYISVCFKKIAETLGSHRQTKWRTLRTTSLSFLKKKEKRSVDQEINSLGEADLSVEAEILPAKKPEVLHRDNVLEFKLTKRMRQKALDAKLEEERIEEEYQACQEYYRNKGVTVAPKAFAARVWPNWVLKAVAWGRKSRKTQQTEETMVKKVPAKWIDLRIDDDVPQEDALRIQDHLSRLSIPQLVFSVAKVQEGDTNMYEPNLLYRVFMAISDFVALTKSDKDLLYRAHLKVLRVAEDSPKLMKIAS